MNQLFFGKWHIKALKVSNYVFRNTQLVCHSAHFVATLLSNATRTHNHLVIFT